MKQAVRVLEFYAKSAALRALVADERYQWLGALTGDGHRHRGGGEGLVKPLGIVKGLSDLPWHKDCGQGRHSYGAGEPAAQHRTRPRSGPSTVAVSVHETRAGGNGESGTIDQSASEPGGRRPDDSGRAVVLSRGVPSGLKNMHGVELAELWRLDGPARAPTDGGDVAPDGWQLWPSAPS